MEKRAQNISMWNVLAQRTSFVHMSSATSLGLFLWGLGLETQRFIYGDESVVGSDLGTVIEPLMRFFEHDVMGDQTSLTSFGSNLAASGIIDTCLVLGDFLVTRNNIVRRETLSRLLKIGQVVAPALIALANTTLEILQVLTQDPRPDNHGMDILMGLLVPPVIYGTLWYVQRRKAAIHAN